MTKRDFSLHSRSAICLLAMMFVPLAFCSVRAQNVLDGDPLTFLEQERYGAGTLLAAMEALASDYATDATEPVRALLSHPDPDVARMAAWLLRTRGDTSNSVTEAAGQLANQENAIEERASAALALGVLRSAGSMAPLVSALGADPAYAVRVRAAEAIGDLHRNGGAEALATALSDDVSQSVRRACAKALGSAPDTNPSALVLALDDDDFSVRQEAAWSLGRIKAVETVGMLVGVLQNDANCKVRAAAAWALGEIGDPIAKQALSAAKNGSCAIAAQSASVAIMKFE